MKRILAIVILFVLVCFSTSAFAELNIDLDSLSYEEMLELRYELDQRLSNDPASHSYIYKGNYYVGLDIKEGIYLLTRVKDTGKSTLLYTYDKTVEPRVSIDHSYGLKMGESIRLNLRENMVLVIDTGIFEIQELDKAPWAP